jgi:hypothetical protein
VPPAAFGTVALNEQTQPADENEQLASLAPGCASACAAAALHWSALLTQLVGKVAVSSIVIATSCDSVPSLLKVIVPVPLADPLWTLTAPHASVSVRSGKFAQRLEIIHVPVMSPPQALTAAHFPEPLSLPLQPKDSNPVSKTKPPTHFEFVNVVSSFAATP